MTIVKRYGVTLVSVEPGEYETEDGRYRVFRDDDYLTSCDEPHPVKLPRSEWTSEYDWETGKSHITKGYLCPGGETHTYTRWNVWDHQALGSGGDYAFGNSPGEYRTFKAAAEELAEKLGAHA